MILTTITLQILQCIAFFITALQSDAESKQELRLQTERERELDQQLKQSEKQLCALMACLGVLYGKRKERDSATKQRLTKLQKDKEDAVAQKTQLEQQLKVATQRQQQLQNEFKQNYSRLLEAAATGNKLKKELKEYQDKLTQFQQLVQELQQSAEQQQRVQALVKTSCQGADASSLPANNLQMFTEVFGKFGLMCHLS